MEKVFSRENVQYTYDTKDEKSAHVEIMEGEGWEVVSGISRLTAGVSIWDNSEDNREWYAEFQRYV